VQLAKTFILGFQFIFQLLEVAQSEATYLRE